MANDKDFIVKNAVEVGGPTKVTLGSITSDVLQEGYSIANASYDNVSFSVASQDSDPYALGFNNDGTKMYVSGNTNDTIYQYTLSTAFDLSTASYDSVSFSYTSQDGIATSVIFNNDGTKMYTVGTVNDNVYQYSLSTAFDLSTASYDSVSFSVASEDTNPYGIVFNSDGTKLYMVGMTNDSIYQYSLSTAYDISTASYDSVSFSVASEDINPTGGIVFNSDGTKMYMVGVSTDNVYQYSLSTAYDLSTASYDSVSFSVASEDGSPQQAIFSADGTKMFILGNNTDTIYQYSTASYADQINLDTGNYFSDTLAANTTYTISNAGDVQSFQVEVTGASTYTITWPSSIEWAGGVSPSAPASGETDVFTITTDDGGTSYVGVKTADNLS